jgi:hypothetical protein
MVFILFEDETDMNIVKMMVGSMIRRDFTKNLKETLECAKIGTRNM